MENIFRSVLNMSLTGSYVILAVLTVRLLLARAPKKYSLVLWAVAGFRLCCPISFESVLSLFRLPVFDMTAAQTDSAAVLTYFPDSPSQTVTTGLSAVNHYIPPAAVVPAEPLPIPVNWMEVGAWIWFTGIALMLLHSLVSYWHLRSRVSAAIPVESNIYRSDAVDTPFVLGFFRPRIYLPASLSGPEEKYVLAHERMHLQKLDQFHKLGAYFILTLHWFNPLCHLAFRLMAKDMEMRCDEAVLTQDPKIRCAYSTALVKLAVQPVSPVPSPLAFGETGVHSRIKNILRWKRPRTWVSLSAAAVCFVSLVACAANPVQSGSTVKSGEYRPFTQVYMGVAVSSLHHYITAYQPNYRISEAGVLSIRYNDEWIQLGELEEFQLTEENFDRLFLHTSYADNGLTVYTYYNGAALRKQVVSARRITLPIPEEDIVNYDNYLFYVLETGGGQVYIATGQMFSDDLGNAAIYRLVCMIPETGSTHMPLEEVTYVTSSCIYNDPVSSYIPTDTGLSYSVEDGMLVIRHRHTNATQESFLLTGLEWEAFPFTEEEWNRMTFYCDYGYFQDARFLDISLQYFLLEKDGDLYLCYGYHDSAFGAAALSTIHCLAVEGSPEDPWEVQFSFFDKAIQSIAALGTGWDGSLSENMEFDALTQAHDPELVLRYCFTRFLNEDAEGQEGIVLAEVCKAILKNHGEQDIIGHSYTDGMDWFRQYQSQAKGFLGTLGTSTLLYLNLAP